MNTAESTSAGGTAATRQRLLGACRAAGGNGVGEGGREVGATMSHR